MNDYIGLRVSVLTNTGKHYCGVLEGCDQATNILLSDTVEMIHTSGKPSKDVPVGCLLLRGDSIAVLGGVQNDSPPRNVTETTHKAHQSFLPFTNAS